MKLDALGQALLRLNRADPFAFTDAIKELEVAQQNVLADLLEAPRETVQTIQGNAQMIGWLLREFRECTTRPPK